MYGGHEHEILRRRSAFVHKTTLLDTTLAILPHPVLQQIRQTFLLRKACKAKKA